MAILALSSAWAGQPSVSLRSLREYLLENLLAVLPEETRSDYCLIPYVRHVFESPTDIPGGAGDRIGIPNRAPTHFCFSASDETLQSTFDTRIGECAIKGFRTLPSVLDSLYTPKQPDAPAPLSIAITLSSPDAPSTDRNPPPGAPLDARFHAELRIPRSGALEQALRDVKQMSDVDVWHGLFDPNRSLYQNLHLHAQQLCEAFEISPGIIVYQSIVAAMFDQIQIASVSSSLVHALTLFTRSSDPLSFATGAVLLSAHAVRSGERLELVRMLEDVHQKLCSRPVRRDVPTPGVPSFSDTAAQQIRKLEAVGEPPGDQLRGPPWSICETIRDTMCRLAGIAEGDDSLARPRTHEGARRDPIAMSAFRFLHACSAFCDTRSEGVELEFGFMLANPFLVRYWPGERPIPIGRLKDGEYQPFQLSALLGQIPAIENPRQRCIAFPYGDTRLGDSRAPCPAYVINLTDFQEAVVSWPEGRLWSSTGGIYAYLTHHYPWSIAALVGPGSQVRVFCGGQVVAFRDGRGWRCRGDPVAEFTSEKILSAREARRLARALEVASQLSPILRATGRGGLLVYAEQRRYPPPSGSNGSHAQAPQSGLYLHTLHNGEPMRLNGQPWLSGRSLLRLDADSEDFIIRYDVARLLLRAAKIDGAVCLSEGASDAYDCRVLDFAQYLTIHDASVPIFDAAGAKRATAEKFTQFAGRGSFAIAVSSDGPINVYVGGARSPKRCFNEVVN